MIERKQTKIHIEQATPEQLDYATAVAQGWNLDAGRWINQYDFECWISEYHPTTDQQQCGELIDNFEIATSKQGNEWVAVLKGVITYDKSRLIAVVKAFLWSKHPDGMIEVQDATTI